MKKEAKIIKSGVAIVGIFIVLSPLFVASNTRATDDSKRLIVHYKMPKGGASSGSVARGLHLKNPLDLASVQIMNVPEGIVRMEFTSPEVAAVAKVLLEASFDVQSVSKDYLYHPAIQYTANIIETAPQVSNLQLPMAGMSIGNYGGSFGISPGSLPDVQAPAGNVAFGQDPLAFSDWAVAKINLPTTSLYPTQQSSIIAALVDTGFDYNHEDLNGALWRSPDNAAEVGYDFVHNNARPYDVVSFDLRGCMADPVCASGQNTSRYLINPGHGTHCMGHVGAVSNNDLGIRGVGIGVRMMAMKFFYDAGEPNAGQGDDAAAIQSIDYALRNGARVINLSWGGRMSRKEGESSELKNALLRAQAAGAIVVIAAGNDGVDQDADAEPSYPAAYTLDNLIVVASTDGNDNLATFSNYGYQTVHIAAPGLKILSTTVGSRYSDVVGQFTNAQGQASEMDWNGTSMSAPLVAGAVATVWSQFPTENYQQIRARILGSARVVPGLAGRVATSGILNVQAALSYGH